MVKLVTLFGKPESTEAFDLHLREVHTQILKRLPNVQRFSLGRIVGSLRSETPYYAMVEMYFEDVEKLHQALESSDGRALSRDLLSFATGGFHMFYVEESPVTLP
ncbi:MAG TPA: EthD family reductase [Chloroflexota bacterium]